jgi:putrescine aminotransferase
MDIEEVLDTHRDHVNIGMARLMRLLNVGVEVSAEGAYVYDHQGICYLDCGGYCVFLLGRNHPRVLQAARQQIGSVSLASRLLINRQQATAAKKLAELAPPGLQYVWFANSGAEAVEAAIKIAKLNGRHRFIAMKGGFHGKTTGALSLTYNPKYRTPFLPLMPGVEFVDYGDIGSLACALSSNATPAAVILESIQSEAGVIIPPTGYLKAVENACRAAGALLIVDEISTGLGRTGAWWYCQQEEIRPDILLCGKALSGGVMPVSALMCTAALYQEINVNPLLHTSTFAGSPLVSAVVSETIDVLRELDAPNQSRKLGESILSGIASIQQRDAFPFIRDVRGRGLLIAIEFTDESYAGEFLLEMMSRHVLVSHSLNAHGTVRLTPSLLLNDGDVRLLLSAIEASLQAIHKRYT